MSLPVGDVKKNLEALRDLGMAYLAKGGYRYRALLKMTDREIDESIKQTVGWMQGAIVRMMAAMAVVRKHGLVDEVKQEIDETVAAFDSEEKSAAERPAMKRILETLDGGETKQ